MGARERCEDEEDGECCPGSGNELARRRGRGDTEVDMSIDDTGKAPCAGRAEGGARRGDGAGGWVDEGSGASTAANGVGNTPRYGEGEMQAKGGAVAQP